MIGRLLLSAHSALAPAASFVPKPRRIGRLVSHSGIMLEAEGFPFPVGTAVRILSAGQETSSGELVGFRGERSLILPFNSDCALSAGDRVEADGHGGLATCGPALLGRVIDAHGAPLDGRGPIRSRVTWPLAGVKTNPLNRARVVEPIDVGVRSINALLTMGIGQRVAIVAGSGVGKSVLMGQMMAGVDADVIVVGLIGERAREVSDFVETKIKADLRHKTVVVAVPADHPPLLRLRAAMRATAIAEQFRSEGKRVFLLIDSLTRVAHAQREIGLALGEPPTMKGYPPSVLGMIPQLVERAGADGQSGGSITAVYTVLADGGDIDDPIVDAARAIVDGHIILSRTLAEQGVYPAINLSRSLSRTMVDVISNDVQSAAQNFRRLWSSYEDNRDLLLLGAYTAGSDPVLDRAIDRHSEMLSFVSQPASACIGLAASQSQLVTEFGA
jgi:flagellum-specific ATP synthase